MPHGLSGRNTVTGSAYATLSPSSFDPDGGGYPGFIEQRLIQLKKILG